MGPRGATHTFQSGMVKDLDKSLVTKERYLDAHNFRLVTSTGETSGALENIEGNNNIANTIGPGVLTRGHVYLVVKGTATYNAGTYTLGQTFTVLNAPNPDSFTGAGSLVIDTYALMAINMYVVGSVYLRNTIVLFITNNTGAAPSGGRSIISTLTLNNATETIDTYTVLYDDSMNNTTGTLNFSTANPIKAVALYETPTIQKVYWCDGYNNVRYANISSYLTTDGAVYNGATNFYFEPDLFEFIPEVTLSKPTLDYLSYGSITAGVVQYAFQYFNAHGAETSFSPLSDTIHITNSDDYGSSNINYFGEGDLTSTSGKSVKMLFTLSDSDRYNYVRIIRLHYITVNSVPTITIVGEVPITSGMSSLSFLDNGVTSFGVLTLDEFTVGQTELFSAEDLAIKNNRLFAANIKKDEFSIGDWDPRAVRYRHWHQTLTDTTAVIDDITCVVADGAPTYVVTRTDNSNFTVAITGFKGTYCSGRNVQTVTAVTFTATAGNDLTGTWHTAAHAATSFDAAFGDVTGAVVSYAGDTFTFTVHKNVGTFFGVGYDHISDCVLKKITFTYTYIDATATVDAIVYDDVNHIHISQPAGDTPAQWDAANWTAYTSTYDGINVFNDPANDGSEENGFQFQRDGATLGAEGPNILIGFTTDTIKIDGATSDWIYGVGTETTSDNKSYYDFASPYMAGRRSWMRDETYRLYIVFFDDRGRSSSAKWVCDLRMPSLHVTGYDVLAAISGSDINTTALYPTVQLKSFPTGAVAAQLLRVERSGSDRSILTQALAVPIHLEAGYYRPELIGNNIGGTTIKLVSPEINITKNISRGSSDYLEYVSNFNTVDYTAVTGFDCHKCNDSNLVAYAADCKTDIEDVISVIPMKGTSFTFAGLSCTNYDSVSGGYGSSGLFVHHANSSWTANGVNYVVANYKRDVHASQYGGQSYEARYNNIAIPASGLLTSTAAPYTAWNGDTFIGFFDVSTQLFDLIHTTGNTTNETVFVPLESSINCNLRHDKPVHGGLVTLGSAFYFLMQETAGTWTNAAPESYTFVQTTPLYQYNTVYSQESTAQFYVNVPDTVSEETTFDCMVKVSNTKLNGELQDSFTLFPVNDFIEVNSKHGELTAIANVNDRLLFWQENAFGILSVNDRSLIQDSSGTALVLGTGGVLDRYDYLSESVGASSHLHVCLSIAGVYWLYLKDKSLYRFTNDLLNVSKGKMLQSWFETQLAPTAVSYNVIRTTYDKRYNEVLISFYNTNTAVGTTVVFDENIDAFSGFYDFYTYKFIPHNNGYLSTSHMNNVDMLFYHNSLLKDRCCFYSYIPSVGAAETLSASPKYVNSTLKLLFNDDYTFTKVFDNLEFVARTTVSDIEIYNNTFSSIRCYDDYQNTDYCTLTYGTNLEKDERGWTTYIPRNAVDVLYTSNPNIFDAANIDKSRFFKERIRDKYMITDFVYTNTTNRRFVVPYITIKYRISPR